MDMTPTPPVLCRCTGPQKDYSACQLSVPTAGRTCLCCLTETARPDRRTATAAVPQFSARRYPATVEHNNGHVNILVRERTQGTVPLPTTSQHADVMCIVTSKTQPCTATVVDDEAYSQGTKHGCNVTSKPALHMSLPNKTTSDVLSFGSIPTKMPSILSMSTTEGNTA